MNSLFITGTGTGVGKTVLVACLAALLKKRGVSFCIYKPLQTGSPDTQLPEDPCQIQQWLGSDVPVFCSYCFAEPLAPYMADTKGQIQPEKILEDFQRLQEQYETVLVEGAGGIRVPIAPQLDMLGLIKMLKLPVLVASSPQLGTINHTLLTIEVLLAHGIIIQAVVISGYEPTEPRKKKSVNPNLPNFSSDLVSEKNLLETFLAFWPSGLPKTCLKTLPVLPLSHAGFQESWVYSFQNDFLFL